MAKRRKLATPSQDDLTALEDRFRDETPVRPNTGVAPIAQVVAEAAQAAEPGETARRVEDAEAGRYREAEAKGLILKEIPLAEIDEAAMIRDRTVVDATDLAELRNSIDINGLRLPIEVFERSTLTPGEAQDPTAPRYGLLSGYRRLLAMRELLGATGNTARFGTIKALLRAPETAGSAFAAMVEENEIRADLSPFERGRIAVVTAGQGVFASTEEAISTLFLQASKAKRSKIRSFALVFEELGDLLTFPDLLKEKQGLRLAAALRNGGEAALRDALERATVANPDEEWPVLEPVVQRFEKIADGPARGGRPKKAAPQLGWQGKALHLPNGVTLRRGRDGASHAIYIEGQGVDDVLIEEAMRRLAHLFGPAD